MSEARAWRVDLPAVVADTVAVRHRVASLAEAWGADGHDAGICAAELMNNAYAHADPPYRLSCLLIADALMVSVSDLSALPPVLRLPDRSGKGVGLLLVDAVAESWGYDPLPEGKSVWCTLPAVPTT